MNYKLTFKSVLLYITPMEYTIDSGCHSVYCIQFNLVFCVKYRRKVLTDPISTRLKDLVLELAAKFDVKKYVESQGKYGRHR